MDAVTALFASAAVLLVIAGLVKVVRPAITATLLDDLGVPTTGALDGTRLTRVLGGVEITVGLVALTTEIVVMAAVVGAMYLIFAGVVWRGMRVGAASCGCFGAIDTPPSWTHVAGNLGLAGSSLWALGGRSPLEVMENQPAGGLGFIVVVGVLAGIEIILFTAVPQAMTGRKPTQA